MKRIAILTSGGDAPGMNAAIRAVTRCSIDKNWEVFGVRRGYAGLIANAFEPLTHRSVGGIIQLGGTMLGSARSLEFKTPEGRRVALQNLASRNIDALVVIGGNGTQTGAMLLSQEGFPVVGIASTIDNDLIGSDITIGVDTALNIALEAIDRIKTTASSHQRAFLVEVMGRDCGYLALMSGITGGAEIVVIPEIETTPEEVAQQMRAAYDRGKSHAVAVVAEGAKYNAEKLILYFREHQMRIGFDVRVTTLGHVQRGGEPTAYDRLLGTRLGVGAVNALFQGEKGILVGQIGDAIAYTPLASVAGVTKSIDPELFKLVQILSM